MPARISRSHTASRPRNLGGTLLTAMTNIASHGLRYGNRLRLFGRCRRFETTGGQHFPDRRDQSLQETCLAESVPAAAPDFAHRIVRGGLLASCRRARHLECDRRHGLELEYVRYIVNEGTWLSSMKETDGRRVAGRQNCGFRQPVEASGRLAQAAVRQVGCVPVSGVIAAGFPGDAVLAGPEPRKGASCARPRFLSVDRRNGAGSPNRMSYILRTTLSRASGSSASLMQQPVGPRTAGLASGIEPYARLADPDEQATDP